MATERSRSSPLHDLLVTYDERHSYIQPIDNLPGPGAYSIPSTFHRPSSNMLLRVVQRENYGREFARQKRVLTAATRAGNSETPCQLCLVTVVDTHRGRRDQLRKLLELAPVNRCDHDPPKSAAELSPRAEVELPSSHYSSNTRSHRDWTTAELTDILADFDEQQPVASEGVVRVQEQLSYFRKPPSYHHFLMSTSYLERMKRQQQRARSCQ